MADSGQQNASSSDKKIGFENPSRIWIAVQLKRTDRGSILEDNVIRELLDRTWQIVRPQLVPLFYSLDDQQIADLIKRAHEFNPDFEDPNLSRWKQLQSPVDVNPYELAAALRSLEDVETAYVMRPGPPPAFNPSDDPLDSDQRYLDPAPCGIDARYARDHEAYGNGIGFIDVEQGWNLNHEDLAAAEITKISGVNKLYRAHGTRVLGVVLMQDNKVGGVGIAPRAQGRVISQWRTSDDYNTPDAILYALFTMDAGDVLLLEVQEYDPVGTTYYWPAEIADATYLMIWLATALRIVVIEAAGNGNRDLDDYHNFSGKAIFDRASADFRESGAIMVGAATSSVPHARSLTNFGSRIDCYAWGDNVVTTDSNEAGTVHTEYEEEQFGFTSAASAIVAGGALVVQGIAESSPGDRLKPDELRTILTIDGTPSEDPATDRIGVMPDLRAIIDNNDWNTS